MARSAALTRFQPDPTDELTLEWVMRQFSRLQTVTQGLDEVKGEGCDFCINHYSDLVGISLDRDLGAIAAISSSYPSAWTLEKFEITLTDVQINTTGASILLRIGDGSVITTGYRSACGTNTDTTGFVLHPSAVYDSGDKLDVSITLTKTTDHKWLASGVSYHDDAGTISSNSLTGYLSLTNALDRFRLLTTAGSFSAGQIKSVYYKLRS